MTIPKDLLTLAIELSMLSSETAENLAREATRSGESAESLLARRGLLSPIQMDVLQTLRRPNDVIPGYELLSLIGHGGMGVVYRARQRTLDRIVAIKAILVSQMSDAKFATRFEQEARAVAKLQHPNIIQAFDFGQQDGRLFFVMEFVEGTDLESSLKNFRESGLIGGSAEELAWCLAKQTASGLSHAAEAGIVHRDIKPANLLLVEPPAGFPLPPGMPLVKIADFGLAFLTNEADVKTRVTAANTAVGSPHYMAPEQLSGQPVDARADIYALGATLFHVLTGQPPFGRLNLTQVLAQKLTAEAPRAKSLAPDISDKTDELIAAMMARQPEQRVGSYEMLLNLIEGHRWGAGLTTQSNLPAMSPSGSSGGFLGKLSTITAQAASAVEESSGVVTALFPATQVFNLTEAPTVLAPETLAQLLRPSSRWSRRKMIWMAGSVATLSLFGWRVTRPTRKLDLKPESLIATGKRGDLFDGHSLRHWQARSGIWQLVENDDEAKVLAGTNGVASRRFDPPDLFAIDLGVWLHQATAVEIHFGSLRGEAPCSVLRIESQSAWLAIRPNETSPSQLITDPIRLKGDSERPHDLRLERGQRSWSAFVDTLLVGVLTLSNAPETPEIRLVVEAGPAWFADISWNELRSL